MKKDDQLSTTAPATNTPLSPQPRQAPATEPYPKALKEQAQLMVAQGLPYRDISLATGVGIGTLKSWACRLGWNRARKATSDALQARQDASTAQAWLDRAATWRERMATLAEERINDLTKHAKTITPRNLEGWLRSLDLLDRIGRRQFGLDTQAAGPSVSIVTSGSVLVRQPAPGDAGDEQVAGDEPIDV